jgi:hypothetical protein
MKDDKAKLMRVKWAAYHHKKKIDGLKKNRNTVVSINKPIDVPHKQLSKQTINV